MTTKPFPNKLEYKVTSDLIEQGVPLEGQMCPIALAICSKYPDYRVDVQAETVEVSDNGDTAFYMLDETSRKFIDAFDRRYEYDVAPFEGEATLVENFRVPALGE